MQTFHTPGPITAVVDVLVGDVRITAGERAETVVRIEPTDPDRDSDRKAADQTRVEYADGRLMVRGPRQRGLARFGGPVGSVDVVVELPAGSTLRAETSVAAIRTDGRLGEARVKTCAGDLYLEHAATVDAVTSAGAITVDRVDGDVDVTIGSGSLRVGTVGGTATLKNSNGPNWVGEVGGDVRVQVANGDIRVGHAHHDVTAHTSNGSIRVDRLSQGVASLRTAMGGIEFGVAAGTAARLDALTRFGQVHNRLAATGGPGPDERTVEVDARTSFGDITVRRA